MPAGLPGSSYAQNQANPSAGAFVIFDPLSGPKGSPKDTPGTIHASTGGLATGIGFSAANIIGPQSHPLISNALNGIRKSGFIDDQIPGTRSPNNVPPGAQNDILSSFMYVGGGRQVLGAAPGFANLAGVAGTSPFTAGVAICGAGNGASRDGGAGPAFTGFPMKMVTAVGAVANGAAIEAGFVNRSGVGMVADQSAHGSAAAQLAAPA